MRTLLLFIFATLIVASCRNEKVSPQLTPSTDSLAMGTDSTSADSIGNPPKAADGLFDDFIYSFMRNKHFQLERTNFPLPNIIDGSDHPIARADWKYDPIYSKLDSYTIIFDSEKSTAAQKDTTLHAVVVEWVYLSKRRVKQYHFAKTDGQWRLVRIEQHNISKNVNCDFYEFYHRFATDKAFQHRHILNPFNFKTHDFDNFQTIEGVLDVEQWPDYRPNLPQGTITNINYGQDYANAKRRVLLMCSPSGGMGCSLTFIKKGKSWMLEKLEN